MCCVRACTHRKAERICRHHRFHILPVSGVLFFFWLFKCLRREPAPVSSAEIQTSCTRSREVSQIHQFGVGCAPRIAAAENTAHGTRHTQTYLVVLVSLCRLGNPVVVKLDNVLMLGRRGREGRSATVRLSNSHAYPPRHQCTLTHSFPFRSLASQAHNRYKNTAVF